jgi:hypothetical protein
VQLQQFAYLFAAAFSLTMGFPEAFDDSDRQQPHQSSAQEFTRGCLSSNSET